MEITSIPAGVMWACWRARSIRTTPFEPRGLSSAALPRRRKSGSVSATATERRWEENSSARIFIRNDTFGFARNAQGDDARAFDFDLALRFVEPFDHGHGVCWLEVGFKTSAENLIAGFETVQIQVVAGHPAGAI